MAPERNYHDWASRSCPLASGWGGRPLGRRDGGGGPLVTGRGALQGMYFYFYEVRTMSAAMQKLINADWHKCTGTSLHTEMHWYVTT